MILTLLIFSIVNLILAFLDAHRIIKGTTINHAINAVFYVALIAIPYFVYHNYWLIGALLVNRLLVFNIMLSIFRGLSWNYMPLTPLSFTDKLAHKIFGTNGNIMYAIYGIIFVALIVIMFL